MIEDGKGAAFGEHLFWPAERWRELQAKRLSEHLRHAVKSPLYARRDFGVVGEVDAKNMSGVLGEMGFTTKDELAAAGREALAVGIDAVREWVCTSGTLGKPLDVPLTQRDTERLAENEAVALSVAGVGRGDLFLLLVGMERMFVAGLAYWLGAQRIGAACVRVGPQIATQPAMLNELIERLRPAGKKVFAIAVPTFLQAVDRPVRGLDGIIAIGEPTRRADLSYNTLGRNLHERFACAVMSTYASTECCTTFAEGPGCLGGHLNPALGVIEIVDDGGKAVMDGEVGEVVMTPLGVEGMPLMRFRTGDMASLHAGNCPCGRTTPRLGPIIGRRQQLLKIRGTSVYPNAILEALRDVAVQDCAVLVEQEQTLSDRVTVFVQLREAGASVRVAIEARVQAALRVLPEIRYVDAAGLAELIASSGSRKARRFIDRRPNASM